MEKEILREIKDLKITLRREHEQLNGYLVSIQDSCTLTRDNLAEKITEDVIDYVDAYDKNTLYNDEHRRFHKIRIMQRIVMIVVAIGEIGVGLLQTGYIK